MTFQDVEDARKECLSKITKHVIFAIVIILFAIIMAKVLSSSIPSTVFAPIIFVLVIIIAITFIVAAVTGQKLRKEYRKIYKAYFIEQNLRAVFSQLQYSHELGLPSSFLRGTGMINIGNRYRSNDYTRAKYKDVSFCQADVHIENEYTDSDGHTHYTTLFKGRFMVFEFPKSFSFKLALVGKKFRAFKIPRENKVTGRKLEKFATESTDFNNLLNSYAEDGFEAFYLLDPKTISTIEEITARFNSKIIFLFVNNQLVIGVDNGKDSFEPPSALKKIDETTEKIKVGEEIRIITQFIDELSLNRKLFKK